MLDNGDRGGGGGVVDNQYEVPFGHLMPRQQQQGYQLGSMSSMQDHFNSVASTQPFLSQKAIQRSSSSMMRPPPPPTLQFYTHRHTDS